MPFALVDTNGEVIFDTNGESFTVEFDNLWS
jgi:hypothetical protein